MNIIGTWRVSYVRGNDEAGKAVLYNPDEYRAFLLESGCPAERVAERLLCFEQKIKFTEDNLVETMMKIPETVAQEEIDEMVASGDAKIVDGMMVMCSEDPEEAMKWKEEDGRFYNTGEYNFETDAMDWTEIEVVDDNTLDYMLFRIVRE